MSGKVGKMKWKRNTTESNKEKQKRKKDQLAHTALSRHSILSELIQIQQNGELMSLWFEL